MHDYHKDSICKPLRDHMTIAVVPDPFGVHDTLSRWSRMLQYRSRSCHFSGDFHACEGECKGAGQLVVAVAPVSSLLQRLDPSNPVAYCVYVRSPYTKPCWVQYSVTLYLHRTLATDLELRPESKPLSHLDPLLSAALITAAYLDGV